MNEWGARASPEQESPCLQWNIKTEAFRGCVTNTHGAVNNLPEDKLSGCVLVLYADKWAGKTPVHKVKMNTFNKQQQNKLDPPPSLRYRSSDPEVDRTQPLSRHLSPPECRFCSLWYSSFM